MIDSNLLNVQENTKLQISIILHKKKDMYSRRQEYSSTGSGRTDNGPPHRRAVPIQDLLNPAVEESSAGPRHSTSVRPSSSSARDMGGYHYRQHSTTSSQHVPQWRAPQRSPRRSPTGSASSRGSGTRREHRPTYSEEETLFIWYHRIDLGYDWPDIIKAYNAQFPDRYREGAGGIQCRYYRCCSDNNIPKVRERRRSASSVRDYGMRARTGLVYPWMRD